MYDRRELSGNWVFEAGVAYVPRYIPLYVTVDDFFWIMNVVVDNTRVGPFDSLPAAQTALVIIAEASND